MARLALIIAVAALLSGAVGSAAFVPVETRTQAVLELQAAIEDERRAIELLKRTPPRADTALARIDSSFDRLGGIYDFLTVTPGTAAAQDNISEARYEDGRAVNDAAIYKVIIYVERALRRKLEALPLVRAAKPPPAVAQCSDGKDNDGDGITDWKLEPGCTSARDVRESSPFSCWVDSRIASGRLELTGSCSGAFSEVDVMLLDDVMLNGRWDIKHAPTCGPTRPNGFRCKAKDGAQNPKHLIDVDLATTSKDPSQRVQLRFYDVRKRQIGRFVVPPMAP